MLQRAMTLPLHRAAQAGAIVLLQGPRGSGKTTLLRREFPGHTYVSLDDPPTRAQARAKPDLFLARLRGPAIVDDLHRAPELVAHLNATLPPARLLVASSRRLIVSSAATLELHAPTTAERESRPPLPLAMLGRFLPAPAVRASVPTAARSWSVEASLLASDIRDLVHVHDLDRFQSFAEAARQRSGQLLHQQSLARQCGVSHRTAVRWLAVLDACFLTLRLPCATASFGRRLIRRPKLHFLYDGGFESDVVAEIYRNACHAGERPDLRHWCDSNGFAIPLVVESHAFPPMPVGIAASPTPADIAGIKRWLSLAGLRNGALIGQSGGGPPARPILRYSFGQL